MLSKVSGYKINKDKKKEAKKEVATSNTNVATSLL